MILLCEKCPNTEFFLVRIFPYSDQKNTPYLDAFHAVYFIEIYFRYSRLIR